MEYRKILDGFLLHAMAKPVSFPDVKLGVGEAENLESQPRMMIEAGYTANTKAKIEPIYRLPYEKTAPDLQGDKLNADMFPDLMYLGETLAGGDQ